MGIVVIGLLDTDCDPNDVDIVIPGNDDALKSVRLLIEELVDSVEAGHHQHTDSLKAVGAAQRSDDGEQTIPGDDVRPTTGNVLPERGDGAVAPVAAPAAAPAPAAAAPAAPVEPKPEAAAPVAPAPAPDGTAGA
ncbi:MAG: small subunit ribosomal protein S2 [Planctomycetota bacterium]|jgi:small subunit ribosomal protein S2